MKYKNVQKCGEYTINRSNIETWGNGARHKQALTGEHKKRENSLYSFISECYGVADSGIMAVLSF